MDQEMKDFIEEMVKNKLSEKTEAPVEEVTTEAVTEVPEVQEPNWDEIFKPFSVGSILEQTPAGNVISNAREHNPERDVQNIYKEKK